MEKMTRRVKEMAKCLGAAAVGITTKASLEGEPPSTDLAYVLSEANSGISILAAIVPWCAIRTRSFEKSGIKC